MDIVDKVAAHLWGTRWDDPGSARAAAQRLADAGLLRQPDPPVLTINVRIPAPDKLPPIGLVVDTARGVVNWEGLNYYARPDGSRPATGTVCFSCNGCDAETEVARTEEGLNALNTIGWSGDLDTHVFCPACTKDRRRTASFVSDEEQSQPPSVIEASCCRCATTWGFSARGDALDVVALVGSGWEVIVVDGIVRFLCSDCAGR